MSQTDVLSVELLRAFNPVAAVAGICVAGKICIEKMIEFSINPPRISDLDSISHRCSDLETAYRKNLSELSHKNRLHGGSLQHAKLNRLTAMHLAISATPLYRAVVDQQRPGGLASLGNSLNELTRMKFDQASGRRLDGLRRDLTSLIGGAERTLKSVERETTLEVITTAMANLGYDQGQVSGKTRFTRGRKVIFAQLSQGRTLTLEAAGFMGNSCSAALQEVQSELNRLGLATEVLAVRPHQVIPETCQEVDPEQLFNEMLCRDLAGIQQHHEHQQLKLIGG